MVRTEEMISSPKIESAYLSRPAQYNILIAGRKNNNYASDSPAAIPASRGTVLSDDSVQQLQQNALMSMAAERSKSESSHLAVPLSFTTTSTQTIKDIPPRQRHHKIFSIQVLPRKRSTVRTLSEDGSPGAADITGIQSVVKGSYSQDRLAVLRGEQSPLLSGSASQTVGSLLKVSDQNTVRESGLHDRDSKLAVTKKKKRGSVIGSLVGTGGGGGGATSTSASLSKPSSAAAASRSSGALLQHTIGMRSNEPLHSDGLGHQSLGAIAVQGGVQSEESGSPTALSRELIGTFSAPSSRPGSRANSESSEGSGMTTPAELILSAIAAATTTKTKGILGARKKRPVTIPNSNGSGTAVIIVESKPRTAAGGGTQGGPTGAFVPKRNLSSRAVLSLVKKFKKSLPTGVGLVRIIATVASYLADWSGLDNGSTHQCTENRGYPRWVIHGTVIIHGQFGMVNKIGLTTAVILS